jgi:CBS-domain-containing membrane protein
MALPLQHQEPSERKISLGIMLGILAGAAGGAIAIALMELLSERAAFPLMFVPFATSIVLVMGSPEIEAAQPRALIGGHLVATLVGLLVVKITGPGPWAAALAVGLAMVAMHLMRSFHPPAGIDPLIIVVNDMSWSFLLAPVALGAGLLAAAAPLIYVGHSATSLGYGRR